MRKFAWTSCPLSTAVMQIVEQKDAAIRGLSNYMFMEAQRMAKVCFLSIASLSFFAESQEGSPAVPTPVAATCCRRV